MTTPEDRDLWERDEEALRDEVRKLSATLDRASRGAVTEARAYVAAGPTHRKQEGDQAMTEIDVTMCPECDQKGRYDGRLLIGGRGIYTCPDGHRWQNADEKPTTKGVALIPPPAQP
jgi:hypothetical protein